MANEIFTRAADPDAPSEEDYQAFCAVLCATARGRAFLAEYARRQRPADTSMLLAAIERLEAQVRNQMPPDVPPPTSAEAMRAELHAVIAEIRAAQKENDVGGLTAQVAQLAATIEQVERRLETIVAPAQPIADAADEITAEAESIIATSGDPEPSHAQATAIPEVGWFNERSSAADEAADPPAALAPDMAAALAIGAVIEAVAAPAEPEPPDPVEPTIFKAGTIPPPTPFAGEDFTRAENDQAEREPPADPLAPIMMLSEEERLALFT